MWSKPGSHSPAVINLFKLGRLDSSDKVLVQPTVRRKAQRKRLKSKSLLSNTMAVSKNNSVTLRHGVEMPLVGIGTSHQGGFSHEAIVHALGIGYRFIIVLNKSRVYQKQNSSQF